MVYGSESIFPTNVYVTINHCAPLSTTTGYPTPCSTNPQAVVCPVARTHRLYTACIVGIVTVMCIHAFS